MTAAGPALEVREIHRRELEAARSLLLSAGWTRGVGTAGEFADLVAASHRALVAVEGGVVVGFLRALGDGQSNGYISMVVVDERHRGRGVGRALVRGVMGENRRITWVLRAARTGVSGFYEKLGFSRSHVAMERPGEGREPGLQPPAARLPGAIEVRAMRDADLVPVIELWRRTEGIGLNESDRPEALAAFLGRNPGMSAVAVLPDRHVGAVLCGHDGRRGYLHHLAVDARHRRRGIGAALLDRSLGRLSAEGITKCNIFVYAENDAGAAFWKRQGFAAPAWGVMQKRLTP